MDKELQCDFYFGDKVDGKIAELDVDNLAGFKKKLKRLVFSKWKFFWLKGSLKPIFRNYEHYIISGSYKYLDYWVLILLSKITKKKVYAWAHGIKGNEAKTDKKLKLLFYKNCSKVLLYGERSKQMMIELGMEPSKLVCIYNSLNVGEQEKFPIGKDNCSLYQEHFKNDLPVIVYTGRIQKSKKLEQLVEALKKINKDKNKCNLVFVGKDLGENQVKALTKKYNLSNQVWFYGPCYDEQVLSKLISCASVCVSPGPIGLTAIHVASYGVPIITNDDFNSQMPEFEIIKPGVNGDFFRLGDNDDMIAKIFDWINADSEKKSKAYNYSRMMVETIYNAKNQIEILKNEIQ
jgi:glycosyltransferase involved in cell wall biosynthesis